jgi:hypothetical protein
MDEDLEKKFNEAVEKAIAETKKKIFDDVMNGTSQFFPIAKEPFDAK